MIVEIAYRVTPDDRDEYDVTASPRDILVWEKTTPGAVASRLQEEQSLADMYKIAWIASRRQGLFDGPLQQFETTCDIGTPEAEELPNMDPTQPEPSAGS